MDYANDYCDMMEITDGKKLREFNDYIQFFIGLTANTKFSSIDFTCTDKKKRKVHVELKSRKETLKQLFQYKDILVEPHKISEFTKIMNSGYTRNEQRLYINFTSDGAVILFNLNKPHTMTFYPNHRHYNPKERRYVYQDRFGLNINDAIIYIKKDGIYIPMERGHNLV